MLLGWCQKKLKEERSVLKMMPVHARPTMQWPCPSFSDTGDDLKWGHIFKAFFKCFVEVGVK